MKQTKPLTFSGIFLTKDDQRLQISEFRNTFGEFEEFKISGDKVHTYRFNFESDYLKIIFSDGSSFPRNPNVININTRLPEPNPRSVIQVEPKEHFALIDFQTCLF